MDDQNKNLLLATGLSFLVILIWFALFPPEEIQDPDLVETAAEQTADPTVPSATTDAQTVAPAAVTDEIEEAPRVAIQTPEFEGTLSLLGGRIDDLRLTQYKETIDPESDIVTLLRPVGEAGAYFSTFGWASIAGLTAEQVPGPDTLWSLESGETLTPDSPVTLSWDNGAGQTFRTEISVDADFMFSFAQSVENAGSETVSLRPYGLIRRHGEPQDMKNFFILQEGPLQMNDGILESYGYDDIAEAQLNESEGVPAERFETTSESWLGYTDHFWQTILIPDQATPFRSVHKYFPGRDIYQAEAVMPVQDVAIGDTATVTTRLFAGAKEWEAIRTYQNDQGVVRFLDSIDWGWFFFLTKPMFWALHELNILIGNMGWAIISLTVVIKLLVLPLAWKSSVSMAKMKELQPQMEALKEEAGEDRQKMQQGMMKLYKDNKVNPAAGCVPILLQIPIFFAIYKVIFVTIELRHAPWIGWIKDLSAPDPSSIFNLWGLMPWAGPEPGSIMALLFIGIMPLFLGVSMWLQQKLNPSPTDPTQKMIFAWMPWVFMFMLGSFASGLVLYWIANNVITFTQQYLIMRKIGAKPDVFGNIMSSFRKSEDTPEPAAKTKPKAEPAAETVAPEAAPAEPAAETAQATTAPKPRKRKTKRKGKK